VLVLPPEAAYAHLGLGTAFFEHGSDDNHTRNPYFRLALLPSILLDVAAVDGFNVAISQQAGGDPFIADLVARG
jgi:hypothetical protein